MRKFKLLALLLAVLMVMAAMTGCVTKKDLDTRVTALEAKADAQATTLADLKSNLEKVDAAVKANKSEIDAAIAALTTIVEGKANAETLNTKVSELTAAINAVKDSVTGLTTGELKTLAQKMAVVEAKLGGIEGTVKAEIEAAVADLTTAYTQAIADAVKGIKEGEIAALSASTLTKINEISDKVAALENGKVDKVDFEELAKDLEALEGAVAADKQALADKIAADAARGAAQNAALASLKAIRKTVEENEKYAAADKDAIIALIDENLVKIHFAPTAEDVNALVKAVEDLMKERLPVDDVLYNLYASKLTGAKIFDERKENIDEATGKSYKALAMEAMLYINETILKVEKYNPGVTATPSTPTKNINTVVVMYGEGAAEKDIAAEIRTAFFRLWYGEAGRAVDYVSDGVKITGAMAAILSTTNGFDFTASAYAAKEGDSNKAGTTILTCKDIKDRAADINTKLAAISPAASVKFDDFAKIAEVKELYNVFKKDGNGDDTKELIGGWLFDAKQLSETNVNRVSDEAVLKLEEVVARVKVLNAASAALKVLGNNVLGNIPTTGTNPQFANLFWQYEVMVGTAVGTVTMADYYYDTTDPANWIENAVKYERINAAIDDWKKAYALKDGDVAEVMKHTTIKDETLSKANCVWTEYVGAYDKTLAAPAADSYLGRSNRILAIKASLATFKNIADRIAEMNKITTISAVTSDIAKYTQINTEITTWRKLSETASKTNGMYVTDYNFFDIAKKFGLNAASYKTNVIDAGNYYKSADEVLVPKDNADYYYLYNFQGKPEIDNFFKTTYGKALATANYIYSKVSTVTCLEDLVLIKGEFVAPLDVSNILTGSVGTYGVKVYNKANYKATSNFGVAADNSANVKATWDAVTSNSPFTFSAAYNNFAPVTLDAFKAIGVVEGKYDLYAALIETPLKAGQKSIAALYNQKLAEFSTEIQNIKSGAVALLDIMDKYEAKDLGTSITYKAASTLSYDEDNQKVANAYDSYKAWIAAGFNPLHHEQVKALNSANACTFRPIFSEQSVAQLGAYVARMEQLKKNIDNFAALLNAINNTTYTFSKTVDNSLEIKGEIKSDSYVYNYFGGKAFATASTAKLSLADALTAAAEWYSALKTVNNNKPVASIAAAYLEMMDKTEFYFVKSRAYKQVKAVTYVGDAKDNWDLFYKDTPEFQNETAFNVAKTAVLAAIENAAINGTLTFKTGYDFIEDRMDYFDNIVGVGFSTIKFSEVKGADGSIAPETKIGFTV